MKIFAGCALASLVVVALASCGAPPVRRSARGPVPIDGAAECRTNCAIMGLEMQSVVLIMNSTGCVCVPPSPAGAPASTSMAGPGAAAGGAMIAVTAAAAAQRRQSSTTTTSHH